MRAALTRAAGGPIELVEVPDPERRVGEIVVGVRAASVNRLDRAVYEGKAMGGVAEFPLIQGVDAAGVVETGGGPFPEGTRVVVKPSVSCRRCRWCREGRPGDCADAKLFGVHRQGGYAQLLAVPRSNLVVLPDQISFAEAAAAAHSHAVVLRMIRAAGELPRDPTFLVSGAGGALGTAAVQLTAALGAEVIAVASSNTKLEAAGEIGATMLANRAQLGAGFVEAIRSATGGVGVDVVIETTGVPEVIADTLGVLARGGRLVLVAGQPGARLDIDVTSLYRNRQRVIGSAGSGYDDFADVYSMIAEHRIHPVIAGRFRLADVEAAMDAVTDRARVGKLVIEVEAAG